MSPGGASGALTRGAAWWAFACLVAVGAMLTIVDQAVFREMSPSGWALAWGLVLLYASPVLLLVFTLDLLERQSLRLLAAALVWGAIPATALSAVANAGWGLAVARVAGPDAAAVWTWALTAPWTEETLKLCGLVLLVLMASERFDDLMDGFVYGAMIGLGFSIVEDVFYFMGVFGGQPSDVVQGFFMRAVASGFYGHLLYSGVAGIGVAYFVTRRDSRRLGVRITVAAGCFLAGVLGHLLWNSPWLDLYPKRPWSLADMAMLPVAAAIRGVPFLLTVGLFVWLAARRERRWVDLAAERAEPALEASDLADLRTWSARRSARRDMTRRAGPVAARLLKRLQREQMRLIMLGARADVSGALDDQRSECRALREALRAMPGAAAASG